MSWLRAKNPYPDLDSLGEVADSGPFQIWVEPTTRCNSRCIHCPHNDRRFGEDMSLEVFQKIRDSVLDSVGVIGLTGLGEPFLAPHFEAMFDACAERGMEIHAISNGILLRDDARVSKIVRHNVVLCLSVDGARAETFEFVRPLIKWETLLQALECIRRNAEAAGAEKRFRLHFIFVPMKQNIGDLPAVVRLAAQYGAERVFTQPLARDELYEKTQGQSLRDSPELVSPAYTEALRIAARLGVELTVPACFRDLILDGREGGRGARGKAMRLLRTARLTPNYLRRNGLRRLVQVARFGFGPRAKAGKSLCMYPWQGAYFTAEGLVQPCCVMHEEFGDLKTQDWPGIWGNYRYRSLRRTIHSWNPHVVCRGCSFPKGINGGDEKLQERFFSSFRSESLALNSPLVQFDEGFFELEFNADGSPGHRWMSGRGTIRLPMREGAAFLRLRIYPRHPARDTFNAGWAVINDGPAEPFDNTAEAVHLPLGHVRGERIDLRVRMDHTFRFPPDTRELALAIRGFEYLS